MGEVMHFMRISSRHHSMAIAQGPHTALHHVSFEMRGIDEYMRGSGRVIRAGFKKIWGPGRHMAGDNTFTYFLDPHGNTVEYTTELENLDEDTLAPPRLRLLPARGHRPVGHRQSHERTRRQGVLQRPRPGRLRRPAGLSRLPRPRGSRTDRPPLEPAMRFAALRTPPPPPGGRRGGRRQPSSRYRASPSLSALLTETDGLPRLLGAGRAALDVPPGPHVSDAWLLPPLQPASVRDFVTFEEHVEGVRRSVDGVAGVPEQWYAAPAFYFTNPHAVYGDREDVPMPPGSAVLDFELEVGAVIGRRAGTSRPSGPATTSSATPCSTTGPRATCRARR